MVTFAVTVPLVAVVMFAWKFAFAKLLAVVVVPRVKSVYRTVEP